MRILKFEKRILAYLLDFILPVLLTVVLYFFYLRTLNWPWVRTLFVLEIIASTLYTIINTLFCYFSKGKTIGGFIVNARVVPMQNMPITFANSFIRYLSLSVIPFVLVNIFFMLSVHTERSIFDRLSDTVIIEGNI